jgi:hypothetical protein
MRQDDGYLSVTWGRMKDICQLHEAALSLYVSYMWQVRRYLSVTWGRMMVICQLHEEDGGYLSVTSDRLDVICQLHEAS